MITVFRGGRIFIGNGEVIPRGIWCLRIRRSSLSVRKDRFNCLQEHSRSMMSAVRPSFLA